MAYGARSRSEQYDGTITAQDDSRVIQLDPVFFKAHPEFSGDVRATVLAAGRVLLSATNTVLCPGEDEDTDSVMLGFLQFLGKQVPARQDLIESADHKQLSRIGKLVEGVSIDDSPA